VCPELKSSFVDLEILVDEAEGGGDGVQALPVYVAAVDLACSEEFLELVKSALLAALEALVPGSLFGLMTFSHKIGLYDVQGPIPLVKNVFIPPDLEEDGLPVALEDAMPLLCFLAPLMGRLTHARIKLLLSWRHCDLHLHGREGLLLGRKRILFCLADVVLGQPCLL